MSVPRFEIHLDSYRTYEPGEVITGRIQLDLTGTRRSRGLLLSCRGGAYVQLSLNRRKLKSQQMVEGREVYVTSDAFIAGTGSEIMVFQPGSYTFEFSTRIPLKVPNTIHTLFGYVRYVLICKFYEASFPEVLDERYLDLKALSAPSADKDIASQNIVLFKSYSISAVPGIANSRYEQAFERIGGFLCGSGEVSFLFSIPRTGYLVGENMHVVADIRNMSKNVVAYSEVAINQLITFKAGGHAEKVQKRICSTKRGSIAPGANYYWTNVPIFIPNICEVTTEHCSIIELRYVAEFSVGIRQKPSGIREIKVQIPLIIGVK